MKKGEVYSREHHALRVLLRERRTLRVMEAARALELPDHRVRAHLNEFVEEGAATRERNDIGRGNPMVYTAVSA